MAAGCPPDPSISSSESCDPLASTLLWRAPTESLSGSEHQFTTAAFLGAGHWQKELDRFERLQFLRHAPHELGPEFQDLRPLLERSRELEKKKGPWTGRLVLRPAWNVVIWFLTVIPVIAW